MCKHLYVCVYACMYTYIYIYMHTCIRTPVYGCMYVCLFVCMYVCMFARYLAWRESECQTCMYVCMYVCLYVYICRISKITSEVAKVTSINWSLQALNRWVRLALPACCSEQVWRVLGIGSSSSGSKTKATGLFSLALSQFRSWPVSVTPSSAKAETSTAGIPDPKPS